MYQPDNDVHHEETNAGVLYHRHAPAILRYFNAHLTIKEDAEDLLVEVFLASFENHLLYQMPSSEQRAWLLSVSRNKLVDHYRLGSKRPGRASLEDAIETLMDDDISRLPEQLVVRQEDHARLRAHIETLKARQQEILQLRFAYGMHSVEIGKRLNKKATAIRATLSRTLNQLRLRYEGQEDNLDGNS